MPADLPPLEERHYERAAELVKVELFSEDAHLLSAFQTAKRALARQVQRNEALQARLAQYEVGLK